MAHDVVRGPAKAALDPAVPRLRGALHAAAFPLALAAGGLLVAVAPTGTARLGAAVYAITSALLFGVSAAYHRGRGSAGLRDLLRSL